jgi:tryptophan-rich sensory protein
MSPEMAFIEIIFLWVLIFLTIKAFYKIDKVAAYLLIPYLLWVTFASILNLTIWILN